MTGTGQRVLACGVVRQTSDVLEAHLRTVRWQRTSASVDLLYIDDNVEVNAQDLVRRFSLPASPKPAHAHYSVNGDTHHWDAASICWLAGERQRLLAHAAAEGYDAVLMVDSDLLLAPDLLESLIAADKPVVSAVFWTSWRKGTPPLPQVWLTHPYGMSDGRWEEHEFLGRIAARQLTPVAGLGACTLIRAEVFDRVGYWPPVPGLPEDGMWQGEDRHFCIRAQRNGVQLWADPWPDVWHCYHASDRTSLNARLRQLRSSLIDRPGLGDLVSFRVEPLEEPELAGYTAAVRGRLGQLRLLPELESELLNMSVGEERFLTLCFPRWISLVQYRGSVRLVRLKLVGARQWAPVPGLEPTDDPVVPANRQYSARKRDLDNATKAPVLSDKMVGGAFPGT